MWLPKRIYERAPQYWLLVGLLLVTTGVYLGFRAQPLFMYLGVPAGIASCIWGLRIHLRRNRSEPIASVDPDLDQTCELNYKPE